jgi:hypothetical protein
MALLIKTASKIKSPPTNKKFQNLNHPKNHEYDGEINETWDIYFSGTAL